MTEKRTEKVESPRGYSPMYEKLIPAAVIFLILVITSYSIHYTKLYDLMFSVPNRANLNNVSLCRFTDESITWINKQRAYQQVGPPAT